jgi:hypothetical protein
MTKPIFKSEEVTEFAHRLIRAKRINELEHAMRRAAFLLHEPALTEIISTSRSRMLLRQRTVKAALEILENALGINGIDGRRRK